MADVLSLPALRFFRPVNAGLSFLVGRSCGEGIYHHSWQYSSHILLRSADGRPKYRSKKRSSALLVAFQRNQFATCPNLLLNVCPGATYGDLQARRVLRQQQSFFEHDVITHSTLALMGCSNLCVYTTVHSSDDVTYVLSFSLVLHCL